MIDRDNRLIAIFGGGGFIGRYVCEELMARGARLRVASRNPRRAQVAQPLGSVGQLGVTRANVFNASGVRRAVEGAAAVVNLVGSFDHMRAAHVTGARHIAEAARDCGAAALVHISAIGADPDGEAEYSRTKGEGEKAVREIFPSATIVRPSLVFGPEDDLTNRFAMLGRLPILPVIAPDSRFQPVFVEDLAKAIAVAALDPGTHGGATYEIAGPEIMTMRQLVEAIMMEAGRNPELVDMPDFASSLLSRLGFLPGAPLTRDQWLMLQKDNVESGDHPGLDALGVERTPFHSIAGSWLGRFWRGGRFAMRSSGSRK